MNYSFKAMQQTHASDRSDINFDNLLTTIR